MSGSETDTEWQVVGETVLHDSPWLKLTMADVVLPDGRQIQHRVIRYPAPTAGTLIHDTAASAVLLIWRHRFITGRWGWEVPAGLADPGETAAEAAIRETAEETGYMPIAPEQIVEFNTSSGIMDESFHGFYTTRWEAPGSGQSVDGVEATRIQWVRIKGLSDLVTNGSISHGHSLLTILMAYKLGLLA